RLRFEPGDGQHVLAFGSLEVYAQRGEYQLVVELLEPRGLGALQLAFEQLKARLHAEGLFAEGRKRPLPRFPRRIGIVTSPSGAAVRDILRIIGRRFDGLSIGIAPARVLVGREKRAVIDGLVDLRSRLERAMRRRFAREAERASSLAGRRVLTDPARPLRDFERRVDEALRRLQHAARATLRRAGHRL